MLGYWLLPQPGQPQAPVRGWASLPQPGSQMWGRNRGLSSFLDELCQHSLSMEGGGIRAALCWLTHLGPLLTSVSSLRISKPEKEEPNSARCRSDSEDRRQEERPGPGRETESCSSLLSTGTSNQQCGKDRARLPGPAPNRQGTEHQDRDQDGHRGLLTPCAEDPWSWVFSGWLYVFLFQAAASGPSGLQHFPPPFQLLEQTQPRQWTHTAGHMTASSAPPGSPQNQHQDQEKRCSLHVSKSQLEIFQSPGQYLDLSLILLLESP